MIEFEWDPQKDKSNKRKHGVSFEEARTVFFDDNATQFFDNEHSVDEERFLLLGMSTQLKMLVVCHWEKAQGDIIRIISARKATKSERQYYAGGQKWKLTMIFLQWKAAKTHMQPNLKNK